MGPYKILSLTSGPTPLEDAEYLPEFDAIVLDPPAALLGIGPGTDVTWPYEQRPFFERMRAARERRSEELTTFFGRGGVLLVRLVQPSWLYVGDVNTGGLDSFSWWLNPMVVATRRSASVYTFAHPGSGTALTVVAPGHPFETYLRYVNSYQAWLEDDLREADGVVVLAENRARRPVAIEVACYRGAVVIVPPPTSEGAENLLKAALWTLLDGRVALNEDWPTAEERKLLEERETVLGEMRTKRDDFDKRLVVLRDLKAGAMKLLHVDRAIGYYRQATAATPTPEKSIPPIWKMLEMLREHYTKGTAGLAVLLGVPKDDLEFVQAIANKKDLNVRHTTTGLPRAVNPSELARVIATGEALVQGTIDYECRLSTVPAVDETAAAIPANGSRSDRN